MQAVARHDVRLAAEDAGSALLDIHDFEQAERTLFMVEKQVDVGIVPRLAACSRTEHVQTLDAEPPQIGFMRPQSADGVIAFHSLNLANLPASFHACARRDNEPAPTPTPPRLPP